jgi:hypothetical protein
MIRKLTLFFIGITSILILCACSSHDSNYSHEYHNDLWGGNIGYTIHSTIKEDPDTGVQYIIVYNSENGVAIIRRDNADGTPYTTKSLNP